MFPKHQHLADIQFNIGVTANKLETITSESIHPWVIHEVWEKMLLVCAERSQSKNGFGSLASLVMCSEWEMSDRQACQCVRSEFMWYQWLNTLRQRQNGHHFADDIFKCILLNENVWITIKNSLKFVPKGPIDNIPALFQIMAWRRPGDKPLSEPMTVSLLTHICVTRPQWVNARLQYLQWVCNGDTAVLH